MTNQLPRSELVSFARDSMPVVRLDSCALSGYNKPKEVERGRKMAMRENSKDVNFENGKPCKLRATYVNSTTGASSSFNCEFIVQAPSGGVALTEAELVKGIRENYLKKFAAIQSNEINWTKVYVEPDVGEPSICFYGFIDPVKGDVSGPLVDDQEYILNLLIEKSNQSRNVVIPGVAKALTDRGTYKTSLEELEKSIVKGFAISDKLTLVYIRINKKDQKENVAGALFTGFRKRGKRN